MIYDGRENTFTFAKDGRRDTHLSLKNENLEEQVTPKVLLVGGKEFLYLLKYIEVNFSMVGKPRNDLTNTRFDDLPIEIQDPLNENIDIVVDDFPNEYKTRGNSFPNDGRENTFTFEKDGRRHTHLSLKDENLEEQVTPKVLLVGGKEFLYLLKYIEVNFYVVGKPRNDLTNTRFDDLPIEIHDPLNEKHDV